MDERVASSRWVVRIPNARGRQDPGRALPVVAMVQAQARRAEAESPRARRVWGNVPGQKQDRVEGSAREGPMALPPGAYSALVPSRCRRSLRASP